MNHQDYSKLITKKLSEVTNEQRDLFIPEYLLDGEAKEIVQEKKKLKILKRRYMKIIIFFKN